MMNTEESGNERSNTGTAEILFDDSHLERNTISSDRAAVLNTEHPEWVLYNALLAKLSMTYHVVRGTEALSPNLLADAGVVVFAAPDKTLSQNEKARLKSFVDLGGGLLLISDCFPSAPLNDLAGEFGVTFLPGVVVSHSGDWDPQSYWARDVAKDHPITQEGNAFHTNWGCAIDLAISGVELIRSGEDTWLDEDGDGVREDWERAGPMTLAVAVEYGAGRVVAIADNAFHDGMLAFPGNSELILGSIEWLASGSP